MLRWIAVLLFAGFAVASAAEVYRWVDEDGNVIYSDRPHPGAEQIKKFDVQTYEAPDLPVSEEPASEPEPAAVAYETVEISVPANDATIRDNAGGVTVVVNVIPALQADNGDQLVLYLDGAAFGEPGTSTTFQLNNVDRGTHQLRAAVVGANGKQLASSSITTFHLHRAVVKQ